jgi:dolichyl-diphosphooligosaccharide--protein glycosyltransferase
MTSPRRLAALAAIIVLAACTAGPTPTPKPACPTEAPTTTSAQAILEDAETATVTVSGAVNGSFTFDLFGDIAPIATANFVALARCGFYEGIWFHRVLADFVIQAGDPQTKERSGDFETLGQGGPGYQFEIEPPGPTGENYLPYTVAMANDTRTNGSQFFVTLIDLAGRLDLLYTIFGRVTEGTDVIDEIAAVPVNDPRVGVPLQQVTIDSIVISGAPEPSPSG